MADITGLGTKSIESWQSNASFISKQQQQTALKSLQDQTPTLPHPPSPTAASLPESQISSTRASASQFKEDGILTKIKGLQPLTRLGKAGKNLLDFGRTVLMLPVNTARSVGYLAGAVFYTGKALATMDSTHLGTAALNLTIASSIAVSQPGILACSLVGIFIDPFRSPDSKRLPTLFLEAIREPAAKVMKSLPSKSLLSARRNILAQMEEGVKKINDFVNRATFASATTSNSKTSQE